MKSSFLAVLFIILWFSMMAILTYIETRVPISIECKIVVNGLIGGSLGYLLSGIWFDICH